MWPLLFYFQYGFRSSCSTAGFPTVLSDRIAAATRSVALDIFKALDKVWNAGLPHKLKSWGISGRVFALILSFLSNRQLRVILDGKSLQEYSVNAGVILGSNVGLTLFLVYINNLLLV